MSSLTVVALGGNALLRRGEPLRHSIQERNVEVAAAELAVIAADTGLVVTHGNGPQIGLLALQSGGADAAGGFPLDVLGAESEGMVGYLLERELRNRMAGREVATLLTQTEVDPADPAFARPTKPIGPVYSESEAGQLEAELGWTLGRDGDALRRVVASPEPRAILQIAAVRTLLEGGAVVIC
ncbi:MAG: carbamate kinase, partial [Thermoanaerobaculia bacterium]|nr:carbamate kinase [Thermoanaerobaculia bacterium]